MDTVNLTANNVPPGTFYNASAATDEQLAARTRHYLLCAQADVCPLAWLCPNTGTDTCDSGEGCPSC